MNRYEKPVLEIKNLEIHDIITASSSLDDVIDKSTNTVTNTINFDKLNV